MSHPLCSSSDMCLNAGDVWPRTGNLLWISSTSNSLSVGFTSVITPERHTCVLVELFLYSTLSSVGPRFRVERCITSGARKPRPQELAPSGRIRSRFAWSFTLAERGRLTTSPGGSLVARRTVNLATAEDALDTSSWSAPFVTCRLGEYCFTQHVRYQSGCMELHDDVCPPARWHSKSIKDVFMRT